MIISNIVGKELFKHPNCCIYGIRTLYGHKRIPKPYPKDDKRDRFYVFPPLETKYTEKPEYPPIKDLSFRGKKASERKQWCQEMEDLNTVEEKIIKLNMPRYYGHRCYTLKESDIPYDSLPFAQHTTKTHVEEKLPAYYSTLMSSETLDSYVEKIKNQVQDFLVQEYANRNLSLNHFEDPVEEENYMAKIISQGIHRILAGNLTIDQPYLLESQMDYDPRREAFWFCGGLPPPKNTTKRRESIPFYKEMANDPINLAFEYTGCPLFQIRNALPLRPIESQDHFNNQEIPYTYLDPQAVGYFRTNKHGTEIPGFWPGDPQEFGFLSYHHRGHLLSRSVEYADTKDALTTQAVYGSYCWLVTQAWYQGFSTFNEITYPLVNQMIITNGKTWSFSTYQLNTCVKHIDVFDTNPRRNVCYITEPMDLFHSIENNELKGFNYEVLKNLIQFYCNPPTLRENVKLKPHLETEQIVANIVDDEKRNWLETRFKQLVTNRPRHRLLPEIHHWEKIFKIDHKTRPLDKKRERWEFGVDLWCRRLCDHMPPYIPRALRTKPYHMKPQMEWTPKVLTMKPKSKEKWAKMFYPESPTKPIVYRKRTPYTIDKYPKYFNYHAC